MYRLNPNILVRKETFKIFIYNYQTDEFFELNSIAWMILEQLAQNIPKEQIKQNLCKTYPNQEEREIEKDIEQLTSMFLDAGLLIMPQNEEGE